MNFREELEEGLARHIPAHMQEAVRNYVLDGRLSGSFINAVIRGDLFEALGRADSVNAHSLFDYGMFFYNYAVAGSYGSKEKVDAYVKAGGLNGLEAKQIVRTKNGPSKEEISGRKPCPVCGDAACEVKSIECGK